jgi:hypothetical protein
LRDSYINERCKKKRSKKIIASASMAMRYASTRTEK